MSHFLWIFCFVGLLGLGLASRSLWRPVAPGEGPRLPAEVRVVAPLAVVLAIGVPIVGVPAILLRLWLLPRTPADRPTPVQDRLAWTAFGSGST